MSVGENIFSNYIYIKYDIFFNVYLEDADNSSVKLVCLFSKYFNAFKYQYHLLESSYINIAIPLLLL